jgi:RNA-binding protein 23/39
MNGFDLAGRPIRVGLGNDKFTNESTANLLQRFPGSGGYDRGHDRGPHQGSQFSGSGGRGMHAGGGTNFDRASNRDDRGVGGASALDDSDVAGVNFSNFSREALMKKLARTDEPADSHAESARPVLAKPKTDVKTHPVNVPQASRCIVLRNMFDPTE